MMYSYGLNRTTSALYQIKKKYKELQFQNCGYYR